MKQPRCQGRTAGACVSCRYGAFACQAYLYRRISEAWAQDWDTTYVVGKGPQPGDEQGTRIDRPFPNQTSCHASASGQARPADVQDIAAGHGPFRLKPRAQVPSVFEGKTFPEPCPVGDGGRGHGV